MASNPTITGRDGVRRALERRELLLHFQPKVELASGAVPGVEALARWQHPQAGLLGPGAFLDAVEAGGLLGPFTDWVLDAALAQRAAWSAAGLELSVAVNVAPATVLDPGFPDRVAAALARHGVPAPGLVIELTEGALVLDHEAAAAGLGRLRTLGAGLSIDDFGTGWSSLARLRRLPFDEVKIDRSFVAGMIEDEDDRAIVRVVVDLARHLDRRVVAEGVEHGDQLAWLAALGCDLAQGFHMGRPMPGAEVAGWLARWQRGEDAEAPPDPARRAVRRSARLDALRGLGADVGGTAGETELLDRLAAAVGWPVATLWLVDEADHVLRGAACAARDPFAAGDFERLTRSLAYRRGTGLPGRVWEREQPLWLSDLPETAGLARTLAARAAGLHGAMAVPLIAHGRAAGVVELHSADVEPRDPDLLGAVARLVAGPLGTALLQAAGRRAVAERGRSAEAVARALARLERHGPAADGREVLCDALRAITDASAVVLWEPAGDHLEATARSGRPGRTPAVALAGETSAVVAAYSSRRPAFIGHLETSPAVSERLRAHFGARSALFQPVLAAGEALGAVAIVWCESRHRPPAHVRSAVEGLLAHAAPRLAGRPAFSG
jgi:EAL domain-containing protein (putative c-di-GMP-specific phosphodiesterase class I)